MTKREQKQEHMPVIGLSPGQDPVNRPGEHWAVWGQLSPRDCRRNSFVVLSAVHVDIVAAPDDDSWIMRMNHV
jgi:hypothetical protein